MVEQNKVTRGNNNDNRWIQNGKKQSFTWYGLTLVTKKKYHEISIKIKE